MLARVSICFGLLATLGGCVQTRDLYAVRYRDRPKFKAADDRPRLGLGLSQPTRAPQAKDSFQLVVDNICRDDPYDPIPPASKREGASWAARNPRAVRCVSRIAAYAVDQCAFITLHQNEFSATANLVTGSIMIAGALATDGYALSGAGANKTAAAALATAVTANAGGIKGFFPGNQTTPVKTILEAAPAYAEAVGLADTADFNAEPGAALRPTAAGRMKLARVHDAAFSNCQANAYGWRPPGKP